MIINHFSVGLHLQQNVLLRETMQGANLVVEILFVRTRFVERVNCNKLNESDVDILSHMQVQCL